MDPSGHTSIAAGGGIGILELFAALGAAVTGVSVSPILIIVGVVIVAVGAVTYVCYKEGTVFKIKNAKKGKKKTKSKGKTKTKSNGKSKTSSISTSRDFPIRGGKERIEVEPNSIDNEITGIHYHARNGEKYLLYRTGEWATKKGIKPTKQIKKIMQSKHFKDALKKRSDFYKK